MNIDWFGEDRAIDYFLCFLVIFGNTELFGGPREDDNVLIVNNIVDKDDEE